MRVYKLYATGSASANAAASITFVKRGKIRAIAFSGSCDSVTDNGIAMVELSFQSASFIHVNDTAGPIDQVEFYNNLATNGMAMTSVNRVIQGLDIDVGAGERLYVNSQVSGTIVHYSTWFVYVDD